MVHNRYDFLMLFDVVNGNPNGDPDANNLPRVDIETGHGLVTDVALKRKIRDFIMMLKGDEPKYGIYIQPDGTLNQRDAMALEHFNLTPGADMKAIEKFIKEEKAKDPDFGKKLIKFMCENFYDIRTFGAVLTLFQKCGLSSGQVLGPVQLGMARSIDPITYLPISVTRKAVTREIDKEEKGDNTMGQKYIVPYGLYAVNGFVSGVVSEKTGFTEDDLALLWQALMNMFEFDRSAARGVMSMKKLIVFKHESKYGNEHADRLFNRVHVERKSGIMVPRCYADYEVSIDTTNLRPGVEILVSDDTDSLVKL